MCRLSIIFLAVLVTACGERYYSYGRSLLVRSEIPDNCILNALHSIPDVRDVIVPTIITERNESQAFYVVGKDAEVEVYLIGSGDKEIELSYGYMEMYPPSSRRERSYNDLLQMVQKSVMKSCGLTESNIVVRETK